MWRVLVFLLVLSQGAFANPAIEDLKAGFEEALNKVKVLQAAILEKHIEIQQKQADLEATMQTVEELKWRLDDLEPTMQTVKNLKLRLDGVEIDVNEKVKKAEQRANQHTNTKTAQVDVFGAWENKAVNTVYQASTDGFVVVDLRMPSGSERHCAAQGFTDSKSSPATLRINTSVADHAGSGHPLPQYGGFMMPVRKGNYWKVTTRGNVCSHAFVNWMPLGN